MRLARASFTFPALGALLVLLTAIRGADAHAASSGLDAARARLRHAARAARVPYPLRDVEIVVWKSARVLALYSRDVPVRAYWAGLSFDPVGPKEREGDGRTPEGDYDICTKYGASRFHRFLGLSYPSPADAWRGYEDGRIGATTRRRIANVRACGRPPPRELAQIERLRLELEPPGGDPRNARGSGSRSRTRSSAGTGGRSMWRA